MSIDGSRIERIANYLIGIQMKQKKLTKTFMIRLNLKKNITNGADKRTSLLEVIGWLTGRLAGWPTEIGEVINSKGNLEII